MRGSIRQVAGDDKNSVLRTIFISMARNMMPPPAGNPTPTITRDLPGTFIALTPSRPDSKRFFQSTDGDNIFGTRRRFRFSNWVFDMSRAPL
jgi:hypothetical protein